MDCNRAQFDWAMGLELNLIEIDSIWFDLDLIESSPIGLWDDLISKKSIPSLMGFNLTNFLIGLGSN